MFPKIIHQIWYQGGSCPDNLNQNTIKLKSYHKKWKYILWDNKKIINLIKNDREVLDSYKKLKYMHQKIDFAKYIILYKMGGVYVDMDVDIIKSFDSMLEKFNSYEVILSSINLNRLESYIFCQSYPCLNNGIMIAKSRTNFMKKIIKNIINTSKNPGLDLNKSEFINRTTGPSLITDVYKNYSEQHQIKILEWDYLEPCTMTGLCQTSDRTYAKHYHNVTWMDSYISYPLYIYFKYKLQIYMMLIIVLIIFIVQVVYFLMDKTK